MTSLQGRHVFISASLPSGARGEEVKPYDPAAIIDAVVAISRTVLLRDGRLVLGGHPTITPLVLTVAKRLGARGAVDVFQSRWFEDRITRATYEIAESGVGSIHFVDACATLEASLLAMRHEMFAVRPAAAMFVGGMSGIVEEYELVGQRLPATVRLPIAGPGGAAALLPKDDMRRLSELPELLDYREYPFLASVLVEAIGRMIAAAGKVGREESTARHTGVPSGREWMRHAKRAMGAAEQVRERRKSTGQDDRAPR